MHKERDINYGQWSSKLKLEYRWNEAKVWLKEHFPNFKKIKTYGNILGLGTMSLGASGCVTKALAQSHQPSEVETVDSDVVNAINHLNSFDNERSSRYQSIKFDMPAGASNYLSQYPSVDSNEILCTNTPTHEPSATCKPTHTPESSPTQPCPTKTPTPTNTEIPTNTPTDIPTEVPTATETNTPSPTFTATFTEMPSPIPTITETPSPTFTQTEEPTPSPTCPCPSPTVTETQIPSPTITETHAPSPTFTATFTEHPTKAPTLTETTVIEPTEIPSSPTATYVCATSFPCPNSETCNICNPLETSAAADATLAAGVQSNDALSTYEAYSTNLQTRMLETQNALLKDNNRLLENISGFQSSPSVIVSNKDDIYKYLAGGAIGGLVVLGTVAGIAYFGFDRRKEDEQPQNININKKNENDLNDPPQNANEIQFNNHNLILALPDKNEYKRDDYFIPETNRANKKAKEIFKQNWEIFEKSINGSNIGFDTKLELAKDFISGLNENELADEAFLKSMRRSFASRIGRQRRLSRETSSLPNWGSPGIDVHSYTPLPLKKGVTD